jgi:HSP20 family protein
VNIRENNDEFMIDVAAPGMKKEQFHIDFENGSIDDFFRKERGEERGFKRQLYTSRI